MEKCKRQTNKETVIFYHGKCTDGFGGAYAAYKKFGDSAEYIPLDYTEQGSKETPFHTIDLTGKNVYMIDVSTDRESIEEVQKVAKSFQLLDHHATAYKALGDCPHCFFDMKQSGAMIAWKHFHETPAPTFIKYIEDGDLWKFKYPETKYFGTVVHNMEHNFKLWEKMEDPEHLEKILEKGKILRDQFDIFVQGMVDMAKPIKFMGHDIYISNCPSQFVSETGNELSKKSGTFAICWQETPTNVKVSLRSLDSFNCSPIATLFGGGGHPQACAFRVKSLDEFLTILRDNENTPVPTVEEEPKKPFRFKLK